MTQFIKLKHIILFFAISLFISSCEDNEIAPLFPPLGTEGYYIVNEGGWGNGNTSISYYNRDTKKVVNDVFYSANDNQPLGDQAQSMHVRDTIGYIIVQNSGKIEVVNTNNFKSIATIDDQIESPRYMVTVSDTKGYVSDWGDGFSGTVKIIDLTTYEVTKTIATGQGTNELLLVDNKLYAVNAGGFGRGVSMVIINTVTDELESTIEIADNPNSLRVDANSNIWVLTSGYTAYDDNWNEIPAQSTTGSLVKINLKGEKLMTLNFAAGSSPAHLNINNLGNTLYYTYNQKVFGMKINETALPATALISKKYYGISVDPIDGTIIGCEATSFETSGNIDIYSATGTLLSTYAVGIAPNSITFK